MTAVFYNTTDLLAALKAGKGRQAQAIKALGWASGSLGNYRRALARNSAWTMPEERLKALGDYATKQGWLNGADVISGAEAAADSQAAQEAPESGHRTPAVDAEWEIPQDGQEGYQEAQAADDAGVQDAQASDDDGLQEVDESSGTDEALATARASFGDLTDKESGKFAGNTADVRSILEKAVEAGLDALGTDQIITDAAKITGLGKRPLRGVVDELREARAKRLAPAPLTEEETRRLEAEQAEKNRAEAQARRAELAESIKDIIHAPDIPAMVVEEIHKLGVAGENELLRANYVSAMSRYLDKPISVMTKGSSGSGKTTVMMAVTKFIRRDEIIEFVGGSPKSLLYMVDRDLKHKVLVLKEAAVLVDAKGGDTDMEFGKYLRQLISDGYMEYPTVEKIGEVQLTVVKRVEGPVSCLTTTTQTKIFEEMENRFWNIHSTETPEQTRAAMGAIAKRAACGLGEEDMDAAAARWHLYDEWLSLGAHKAVIPFSNAVQRLSPPTSVRMRRDLERLLSLIRAYALLHQAQRETNEHGYIVAALDDYEMAREMMDESVTEAQGRQVSRQALRAFSVIYDRMKQHRKELIKAGIKPPDKTQMSNPQWFGIHDPNTGKIEQYPYLSFSRKQLGPLMGVSDRTAAKYLDTLYEHELIINGAQRFMKPRLELGSFPNGQGIRTFPTRPEVEEALAEEPLAEEGGVEESAPEGKAEG